MSEKVLYLIIYAIIVCLITIKAYIKKENLIYRALWTMFAVSAVFSVICKLDQGTFVGYGVLHNRWYDLSDTTWWAYALIIVCNLIAFKPLKEFNKNDEIQQFGSDVKMKKFFVEFAYIYLLFSLFYIITSLSIIRGVIGISDFGALRASLFSNSENEGSAVMATNIISKMVFKLCLRFRFLSIFIAFAMIKERTKVYLACLLIADTFFLYYLNCAATAARGGLLIFVFIIGVIGLIFFPYLSKANKRRVFIGGIIIFGIVFLFFMAVTLSRLASDKGGGNLLLRNISFYLGHAPIEFSKITGSLTDFAWGKTILGRLASHFFKTPYSWPTISNQIGFPDIGAVFVTYLGYMYTDFGAVGCIAFVLLWMLFTNYILKKRPNKISTIFFFLYYLSFYVTGNFTVGRLEFAAVTTTFVMYFVIRFIERAPALRRLFTAVSIDKYNTKEKVIGMKGNNNVWNSYQD
ncbi:MAG: oligosaccharide repeat unit polymerase [Lachnospiraceae bacterium]|nr:oligosaccharide repeat unit polymerase [Lachnospiraceae bacterium]